MSDPRSYPDTAEAVLTEIIDYFITAKENPGDFWAHDDSFRSYCLDHKARDGTVFWLDLESDGTIKLVWRPAGAEMRSLNFVAEQPGGVAKNENVALRAELNKALREIVDLRMPIGAVAQASPKPKKTPGEFCTICSNFRTRKRDDGWFCYDCNAHFEPKAASSVPSTPAQAAPNPLPRKSAMETALRYMRIEAARLEEDVRTVSGAGEGAEIYRDAAKCIAFVLSSLSSTKRVCPNGLDHGNCGFPDCVSSCPGRLSLSSPMREGESRPAVITHMGQGKPEPFCDTEGK